MHLIRMINKRVGKRGKRLERYEGYSSAVITHRLSFSGWETGTHFSSRSRELNLLVFLGYCISRSLHFELQPGRLFCVIRWKPHSLRTSANFHALARSTSVVLICARSWRNLACLASLRICKRHEKLLRRYEINNVFRADRSNNFQLCLVLWISQCNHRAFHFHREELSMMCK